MKIPLSGVRSAFLSTLASVALSVTALAQVPPPTIASCYPAAGPVGTSISVNGSNLTGATSLRFNGTAATFVVNSITQISTTVPLGATSGPVTVTTPGGTATGPSFTVNTSPPRIASYFPTSGPVGTSISINGTSFIGTSSVKFNGVAATTFTVQSDTQIAANVPAGATTGTVTVTTSLGTGTGPTFTVNTSPPTITSYYPTSGPVGTSISINGANFIGTSSVKFNGVAVPTFTVYSDTQIGANVPAGATTGPVTVTTSVGTGTGPTFT
ncbi:MAG: hypothetical protein M3041_02880, partial [Acidobacteriota bacterium]|nr:hypothetical protein [Acidobacteriota bacterium]